MDTESQPVNWKESWISRHPRIVIGVILVACLGPFINKAIHVDDMLFVRMAEWIQKHPADFLGSKINIDGSTIPMWVANPSPPLMAYFLAGVATVFGWHEVVLHLACLVVAFMAATGIYSLAKMWCGQPLLATVVAIFMPAFLVCSTTLMCDVLMLSFWIWAVVFWERASTSSGQSQWLFVMAGALAGLAVLTKFSALILLPLLPILSILRTRKLGWWLLGLAVPLMVVVGYEWITARMYGKGLLFNSTVNVAENSIGYPGGWKAKLVVSLAFTGGSLLPLLFFAPWLWRRRALLAMGVAFFGIVIGIFWFGGKLGLLLPWENDLAGRQDFLLQVGVLAAAGVLLLLLVGVEVWRRRDFITVMLGLWIISELFFWTMLNHHLGARRFLPVVPAVAILLVRRLETTRENCPARGWFLLPLITAATITLSIAVADYRLANSTRTAAEQIAAKYKPANHQLWFAGGFGTFQYYLEKLGGQRIDVERSLLQPGDIFVEPWFNNATLRLPPGSVGWIEGLRYEPRSWMNSYGQREGTAAGFYSADCGPVPFAIGGLPTQVYFVVKVYSAVQYHTRPANPGEVLAGGLPSYTNAVFLNNDKMSFPFNSEAMTQVQLAGRYENEGKIEEAIQHYRNALDVDSNNPVLLNNVAWILATANRPELRNGEEAVQSATRAVELTDYREPLFMGTLAAAYAEAGRFQEAVDAARNAEALAVVTGQNEIAAKNAELMVLYASGKAVGTTPIP